MELKIEILKLAKKTAELVDYKPLIFDLKIKSDKDALAKLFADKVVNEVIDTFNTQFRELTEVNNPKLVTNQLSSENKENVLCEGVWVYYPWKKCLVHLLSKDDYVRLRTSRNAYLITENEQKKFADARIGIAGLNVGNPGAICITLEGGSRKMKFADLDPLSVSNLNRFRAGICELNLNKVILSARQAYEIDPFIDIEVYDEGITTENIDRFLTEPKIDLLIEEMDNLKLKLLIREKAKEYGIPVLMVTADGIVDIERYDLDPNLPILAGNLNKEVVDGINAFQIEKGTLRQKVLLAQNFIGSDLLSGRLNEAFTKIGETLPSIPQLAEWTYSRGAILGSIARKIFSGEKVESGRYLFSLEKILDGKVR